VRNPLEKEAYFLRYFQDDDQGGDDEIDEDVAVADAGLLSVTSINSSYDADDTPEVALLDVSFVSGTYLSTIVDLPVSDDGSNDISFLNGSYLPTIVDVTVADDSSVDISFTSGVYTLVVVDETYNEDTNLDVTFVSGSYVQVIDENVFNEDGSHDVSFLSGSYT
jgi:hypothetical protein